MPETEELTADEQKAMQNAPDGVSADEIADYIAAVDAVKNADAPPEPQKPAPAAKPALAASPNGDEPPPEPELPAFTAQIRKLEAEQKAREEAKQAEQAGASKYIEDAKAHAEQIRREAEDYARQKREEFSRSLRERPVAAIKEAGIDPDLLVSGVVKEGSPEWQLMQAQAREISELKSKLSQVDEFRSEIQREREERQRYEQWQHQQRIKQEFVSIANPEKAAALHTVAEKAHQLLGPLMPQMRGPDDWKILFGDHAAATYQQMSGKAVASLEEIVQHLNYLASQQSLDPASQQSQAPAPKAGRNGAGQPRAQGPRTLSAATAGERRSAPKKASQMSDDELQAAMIAAAEESMRQTR